LKIGFVDFICLMYNYKPQSGFFAVVNFIIHYYEILLCKYFIIINYTSQTCNIKPSWIYRSWIDAYVIYLRKALEFGEITQEAK